MTELAAAIRRLRETAGLSQPELGSLVGYTKQYISLAERPKNGVPSRNLIIALDKALDAGGTLPALHAAAKRGQREIRHKSFDSAIDDSRYDADKAFGRSACIRSDGPPVSHGEAHSISAHIPALRRALDSCESPEDGPVRSIEQLRPVVLSIIDKRLRSDYAELAREVPELLPELYRAIAGCPESQRASLARLLFQVYRAADAIAEKHGYRDLSARIIGLLCSAAAETGDELVQASSSYVRGEVFFSSGDLTTGRMMLEKAAERIQVGHSDSAAATYGALHMRAAVMAARAGHAALATGHIDEARQVAVRVNEGIHLGTAFGAASVRIHRMSLAVELGDFGAALRTATGWQPPINLPAERRSHFYIDLGRAYYATDQTERALDALHTAHCVAPEHVRAHPHVREMIEQMHIAGPGLHSTALSALQHAMS
ncbi:helix-turn-helix transcriptional regulator [Nocardia sp. NPDC004568]|uniref:helix-turn-helix domain-containing protein n=1 Tax=Nocardia sp. NPDC004568 TaxID=3154551 RepID=UPI0033B24FB6